MSRGKTSDLIISILKRSHYTGGVTLKAAGAYLWELRTMRGLSRADVGKPFETNDVQIMRVEKGELDTRYSLFFGLIDLLSGDANVAMRLVVDPTATEEEARRLAREALPLSTEEQDHIARLLRTYGPERLNKAAQVIADLEERGVVNALIEFEDMSRGVKPRRSRLSWRRGRHEPSAET
jgi:predicted transcriptional regulator